MVTVKLFHQLMIRLFFIINFCLISYISLANEEPSFSHIVAEMKTVEGNFSQQVIDQRGSVMQEVGGNFLFKKPNFFKWNYIDPIQSQIISDGELLYLYDPDLKQVVISSLKKLGGVSPAMLLVSSSASEHFIVKSIRATDHISIYEAIPKKPSGSIF